MTTPASSSNDVVWLARNDDALVFAPADTHEGQQGWATYQSVWLQEAGSMVFVRFGVPGFGLISSFSPLVLVVRELLVMMGGRGWAVSARLVRELPFAQMEAAATRRAQSLDPPPMEGDFPFIVAPHSDVNPRYVPTGFEPWAQWVHPPDASEEVAPVKLYVPVPDTRKKPDEFYRQVADRFTFLLAKGSKRPANDLADANGVPASTVHRWIKEARRRGILPAGQRGKGR